MFTNFLGYVSTKALRVALVVALGATLAALTAVALVATSGTAVGQQGQAPTQPLYEVHDLGTLAGGRSAMPSASTKPARWSDPRLSTQPRRALRSIPSSTATE